MFKIYLFTYTDSAMIIHDDIYGRGIYARRSTRQLSAVTVSQL